MKALLVRKFGPLDELTVEQVPSPKPSGEEVAVEIHAAAVNFPDLLTIEGKYQLLPPLPFSPGRECSGVVSQVGARVEGFKVGQRVLVQVEYGAFAQELAVAALNCYPIPDAMAYEDAAAMGMTYTTAHLALVERGQLRPGEVVLVTGAAGGIGLATVQVAKALGATVLAAVSSPDKAEAARASGADHIIDTSAPDLRNSLREQVYAAVGRHGADIIVENVGGELFDACMRAVAWCGRIVVVGFAGGHIPEIKAGHVLVKNISVIGLQGSDYRDRQPSKCEAVRGELVDLYLKGRIKPRIMATLPLERYLDAFQLLRQRKAVGKVFLTPR